VWFLTITYISFLWNSVLDKFVDKKDIDGEEEGEVVEDN